MMRFSNTRFAACILLAIPACLTAQKAGPAHAPDFRAIQHIAPLYIPPKSKAPFMAIAKTEWVRTLPDGSTVTVKNARVVVRDMEGRIFQERRTFVPVPDTRDQESRVYATEYLDPVAHLLYRCDPDIKLCNLFAYNGPVMESVTPTGLQPDKTTYLAREDLGVDTFAGLEVQRSRETLTLYAQTVGNTRTILRTTEFWYSSALGVNVQVKRHDPRDGDQTLWLSEVSTSVATPDTFKVPSAYRIVDHRLTEPLSTAAVAER